MKPLKILILLLLVPQILCAFTRITQGAEHIPQDLREFTKDVAFMAALNTFKIHDQKKLDSVDKNFLVEVISNARFFSTLLMRTKEYVEMYQDKQRSYLEKQMYIGWYEGVERASFFIETMPPQRFRELYMETVHRAKNYAQEQKLIN